MSIYDKQTREEMDIRGNIEVNTGTVDEPKIYQSIEKQYLRFCLNDKYLGWVFLAFKQSIIKYRPYTIHSFIHFR